MRLLTLLLALQVAIFTSGCGLEVADSEEEAQAKRSSRSGDAALVSASHAFNLSSSD